MMPHKMETLARTGRDDCGDAESNRFRDPQFASGPAEGITQRREAPRYKVELDLSLNNERSFYVGYVENISRGGVFVATHLLSEVGTTIELCIHLPNSDAVVQGLGEVRWVRAPSEQSNIPPGMGIRFVHLEPEFERLVADFLSTRESLFFDGD